MAENKSIMPYDGNYTPLYGYDLSEEVYRTAGLVWDVDTLSWVKAQQALLKTDNLEVTVDFTDTNNLIQEIIDSKSLACRVDEASATVMYVGEATPGELTSTAKWRIKKVDQTSGVVVTWADGNNNFDNVWDNRVTLSYS